MIVRPCISGLKMGCADWPGLAGLSWDGNCPSCADSGTESEGRGSVPEAGMELEQLKQQMPRTPRLHLHGSRREVTHTRDNEHTTVRAFYGGKG